MTQHYKYYSQANDRVYTSNWKWIKFCKLCGMDYEAKRGSFEAMTNLCYKHRNLWYKELYKIYGKEHDKLPRRKKMWYKSWLKWVKKNYEKRRAIALASYHRRKQEPKNKARKHRRTREKLAVI